MTFLTPTVKTSLQSENSPITAKTTSSVKALFSAIPIRISTMQPILFSLPLVNSITPGSPTMNTSLLAENSTVTSSSSTLKIEDKH